MCYSVKGLFDDSRTKSGCSVEFLGRQADQKKFQCPLCEGKGYITGFFTRKAYDNFAEAKLHSENYKCHVCDGKGYTAKKMRPKMVLVQDGWEEEPETEPWKGKR